MIFENSKVTDFLIIRGINPDDITPIEKIQEEKEDYIAGMNSFDDELEDFDIQYDLLSQCIDIEEKSSNYSKYLNNDTNYMKLPMIFTSLDRWKKDTENHNLCCGNCCMQFSDPPVFIPKTYENTPSGKNILTSKCFCYFNCAITHINETYKDEAEKTNKIHLLKLLYRDFHNMLPMQITEAPTRFERKAFGGTYSDTEFSEILFNLKKKDLNENSRHLKK
jgi:hypothetical protein